MKKTTIGFFLSISYLYSAGYQNPNQSIDASALSTANVAYVKGADTAYYNPANMVHNPNKNDFELDITYISLSPINYKSSDEKYNINSNKITAFIPTFHYVSPKLGINDIRLGLSITSPFGLTREWDSFPANVTSKKYALKTIEINPTMAWQINDKTSFALGIRYLKGDAEAILDGQVLPNPYYLSMNGNAYDIGYNIAIAYHYTPQLHFAITYRSKMVLNLTGTSDAILSGNFIHSNANLSFLIPANLIVAVSYTFSNKLNIEVVYDKTYWSDTKKVDFDFSSPLLESIFGKPTAKKWNNSTAYRIGITKEFAVFDLLFGAAYGTNPAPQEYVSFSSVESDSYVLSSGIKYKPYEDFSVGMAILYSKYDSRTVYSENPFSPNGTFDNKSAFTLSLGVEKTF